MKKSEIKRMICLCLVISVTLLSCSRKASNKYNGSCKDVSKENTDSSYIIMKQDNDISQDSFAIEYRQKICGYKVKAILKPSYEDNLVLSANIYFTKNNRTFMLHSKCFGDTVFCKGRYDPKEENLKILIKYNHKTVKADYTANKDEQEPMLLYKPFFFKDLDFDEIPELIIVHNSLAARWHNGYDVYHIVEGVPILMDKPPYYNADNNGFGMTDYPRFDYRKKTISCPIPEGEVKYDKMVIYGISTEKEKIIVDGRNHYFNKLEKIKLLKFE